MPNTTSSSPMQPSERQLEDISSYIKKCTYKRCCVLQAEPWFRYWTNSSNQFQDWKLHTLRKIQQL